MTYRTLVNPLREFAETHGLHFDYGNQIHGYGLVKGRLEGIELDITHTHAELEYTDVMAAFPEALGLGLQVSAEGFLTGVQKFFGGQDIETGDRDFDDRFLIRGLDPVKVLELLDASVRERLDDFVVDVAHFSLTDEGLQAVHKGALTTRRLDDWVFRQIRLAQQIQSTWARRVRQP